MNEVSQDPIELTRQQICLECGAHRPRLYQHVRLQHGLTSVGYRDKYDLPADIPLLAESEIANQAATYARLPDAMKERILSKLPLGRQRSAEARKGRALSDEHRANIGTSNRGRTHERKIPLWVIASDTLHGLSSAESAKKLGDSQGNIYSDRRSLGFPAGYPGTYRHGEVLTLKQFNDFCADTGLNEKEAAGLIGLSYGWLTERIWREKQNRPLSKNPQKPSRNTGRLLAEKWDEVIEQHCYEDSSKRWHVRNFLESEIRSIQASQPLLVRALSALGEALKLNETTPEAEAILDWVCKRARMEVAAQELDKPSEMASRTLLFFGLALERLLKEQPELIGSVCTSRSGFRPGKIANALLALEYRCAPGRIEAVVNGEVDPLPPRGLRLALMASTALQRKKDIGRKKIGGVGRSTQIGEIATGALPKLEAGFVALRNLKHRFPADRSAWLKELQKSGFLPGEAGALVESKTAEGAAIRYAAHVTGTTLKNARNAYYAFKNRSLKPHSTQLPRN